MTEERSTAVAQPCKLCLGISLSAARVLVPSLMIIAGTGTRTSQGQNTRESLHMATAMSPCSAPSIHLSRIKAPPRS